MGSSKLLIQESPMQFQPSLAKLLGSSDRAIVLQQIHYWMERSGKEFDGKTWVFNTIGDWENQFIWMSESTVKRTLKFLTDENFLITGNYNKQKFDKTKWYTIDYERLNSALGQFEQIDKSKTSNRTGQFDPMEDVNLERSEQVNLTPSEQVNLTRPIPLDYQETNQETTPLDYGEVESINPAKDMLEIFNSATNRQLNNSGIFGQLVFKNISVQEFQDVMNYIVDSWSEDIIAKFSSTTLVKKFDQYSDKAIEFGYRDGKRPKKPTKGKQEPKIATNAEIQQQQEQQSQPQTKQPADSPEDLMAMLNGRHTHL
ncbi:hypothetical protein [Fructobacillus evanidus]|uniref:DNA replication protein DnaD (DnaD) n=1 Tax=Fructobacillus evanidus TaxID=3064281 RepID=A0ABN9YN71_9LACO|nr:DNA replication protein DnaD (DnaD) [Fructobacillus sp. LMG 32999]CAK1222150.1 DNA replication protein DnaD (DnaD) [Fructobacillus sp. LMG 32999]CAK1226138.1 DNA replication protein DnaD (DnaD) [Fructobacillus sp. LMG 32999]CAK1226358.1 DNA replication protein DnaD (DnaD) [Fructobacillus sp. LMG 32999]CAK1226500.1 DNA replication protein DnaD (DnaD) [Fructobacillus sp. LMG 32999]